MSRLPIGSQETMTKQDIFNVLRGVLASSESAVLAIEPLSPEKAAAYRNAVLSTIGAVALSCGVLPEPEPDVVSAGSESSLADRAIRLLGQ